MRTLLTPFPLHPGARSRVRRLVAGLWLAAFALFTAGLPILDAAVGHATDVVAHWEDAGDRDCPPQHDPSTCQLCQSHSVARRTEGATVAIAAAELRGAARPATGVLRGRSDAQRGVPTTRGPPLG
jgi:hypothetical protein